MWIFNRCVCVGNHVLKAVVNHKPKSHALHTRTFDHICFSSLGLYSLLVLIFFKGQSGGESPNFVRIMKYSNGRI